VETIESNTIYQAHQKTTPWYAVHTRYQHEHLVEDHLVKKGFETFFPTSGQWRQWSDRKKRISCALFPGYLFIAGIEDRRLQILGTPGVSGIVSVAGAPAAIPDQEIEAIRRAISSPYPVESHPFLTKGAHVCVVGGPLAGVNGILERRDKSSRLVLSVELLGRSVALEIDAHCVERTLN
jgi:transcription antitermination factor NusG